MYVTGRNTIICSPPSGQIFTKGSLGVHEDSQQEDRWLDRDNAIFLRGEGTRREGGGAGAIFQSSDYFLSIFLMQDFFAWYL